MPPKTKFEMFKDFAKEAGEKGAAALGNPEAKFKQNVKERMKATGETENVAQGICLADIARTLQAESAYGLVEKKSQGFREFQGALKAILSREEIKRAKQTSETSAYSAPPGISVTADDIKNQKAYFEQKFKNYGGSYVPDNKIISRYAQQAITVDALLVRLATSGSIDVADLKAGGATSADIGKIINLKENMDRSESLHEFRLGTAKVMRTMWESAKTDITEHIWGDVKNMFGSIFSPKGLLKKYPDFVGLLLHSTKLAIDVTLLLPKALAKGALNSLTLRPDRVY